MLGAALIGAASPLAIVGSLTLLQRTAPGALQGRAYTAFELTATIPQIIAVAAGAALVGTMSYHILLLLMIGLGSTAAILAAKPSRKPVPQKMNKLGISL